MSKGFMYRNRHSKKLYKVIGRISIRRAELRKESWVHYEDPTTGEQNARTEAEFNAKFEPA